MPDIGARTFENLKFLIFEIRISLLGGIVFLLLLWVVLLVLPPSFCVVALAFFSLEWVLLPLVLLGGATFPFRFWVVLLHLVRWRGGRCLLLVVLCSSISFSGRCCLCPTFHLLFLRCFSSSVVLLSCPSPFGGAVSLIGFDLERLVSLFFGLFRPLLALCVLLLGSLGLGVVVVFDICYGNPSGSSCSFPWFFCGVVCIRSIWKSAAFSLPHLWCGAAFPIHPSFAS